MASYPSQIARLFERSPFYRNKLRAAGFDSPGAVGGLERIAALPFTEKDELRRSQAEWFSRVPEATRREVALSQLRQAVRERMNLPPFEDWLKKEAQMRMFG